MAEAVGSVPSKIGIMVCGRAGIGKSTLLNIVFGTKGKFFVNGPGGVGDNCMEAGTKDLVSVSEMIYGVEVTMYDTPGLQSYPSDEDLIVLMANVKERIDLVLFCVDGVTTRWTAEAETVRKLHASFGNEFWTNAIFVLTRSNMVQNTLADDDEVILQPNEKIAICEKAAEDIFESFKKELLEQNASAGVVKDIPLVAAGNHTHRTLHFVAPGVHDADFLPELWSLAVKRCKVQTKLLFFMVSNYKQQRFVLQDDSATLSPEERAQIRKLIQEQPELNATSIPVSEETNVIPKSQPILLSKKQSNRVHKALAASLYGLVAVVACGVGVAAGAVLLATTSVTLVVAAPVGIVIAAPIWLLGGAVLTGVLIYQNRKSKKLKTS